MTMPLNVLEVPQETAKNRLRAYRGALRKEHTALDRQIATGYFHIAQGRQVLTLTDTIRAGGFDDLGRPRLAVARAGTRHVFMQWEWGTGPLIFADNNNFWSLRFQNPVSDHALRVRLDRPDVPPTRAPSFQALVPLVPPEHRPARALDRYHILFEADWRPTVAPRDPALIKHIGGDLWAVYAVWDLTELERAVLAGR